MDIYTENLYGHVWIHIYRDSKGSALRSKGFVLRSMGYRSPWFKNIVQVTDLIEVLAEAPESALRALSYRPVGKYDL